MKRKVELIEDEDAGLVSYLNKRVLIFTAGYFYEGKLTGVNTSCVEIIDAHIVYETGKFSDSGYKDRQKLHCDKWNIATGLIESFGESKCK